MSLHDDSEVLPDGSLDDLGLGELERRARNRNGRTAVPLREWVALAEAWRIAQALRETRGNRSAAARILGIGRRTLYSKMAKLGLEATWNVPRSRCGFAARPVDDADRRD
jgi:two-component system NtrC family response regulator